MHGPVRRQRTLLVMILDYSQQRFFRWLLKEVEQGPHGLSNPCASHYIQLSLEEKSERIAGTHVGPGHRMSHRQRCEAKRQRPLTALPLTRWLVEENYRTISIHWAPPVSSSIWLPLKRSIWCPTDVRILSLLIGCPRRTTTHRIFSAPTALTQAQPAFAISIP